VHHVVQRRAKERDKPPTRGPKSRGAAARKARGVSGKRRAINQLGHSS